MWTSGQVDKLIVQPHKNNKSNNLSTRQLVNLSTRQLKFNVNSAEEITKVNSSALFLLPRPCPLHIRRLWSHIPLVIVCRK